MPRKSRLDRTKTPIGDDRFAAVVNAFTDDPMVTPPGSGKGFGSGALKVNGKIFAMMSSRGQFVVKLSEERVNSLIADGKGTRFDPGHGRLMKEWLVATDHRLWLTLAREARRVAETLSDHAGRRN